MANIIYECSRFTYILITAINEFYAKQNMNSELCLELVN